jgi:uncharacterized membrane protein YhhN
MVVYPLIAAATLAGLLYAEKTGTRPLTYVFKPVTSLMFILTAASAGLADAYSARVFYGLILCLIGDVLLIPKGRAWFLAGLISFLLGHILYIVAFSTLVSFASLSWPFSVLIPLISLAMLIVFWRHLGAMRIPVIAYIICITLMVWGAWAVFFHTNLSHTTRLLIALGATCFYISDLSVAIDHFIKKDFTNRAWGLPLYYLGQFLLAFSLLPSKGSLTFCISNFILSCASFK